MFQLLAFSFDLCSLQDATLHAVFSFQFCNPHLNGPTFLWMTPNGMMSTIIFWEMLDCKT
jgi:hypothetical protein